MVTDLDVFRKLNRADREAQQGSRRRPNWRSRIKLIKEIFPEIDQLDWESVFTQDPTILGRVWEDILKVDLTEPGRPGPRPTLEAEDALARYRQLTGEDYSTLPFREAFAALQGVRSIRHVASRTGLTKSKVQALLSGEYNPTVETLEQIAAGFGKRPDYFLEWRAAYVAAGLMTALIEAPERSILVFRRLQESINREAA